MIWIQCIIFLLILNGMMVVLDIRLPDFFKVIFTKNTTLKEDVSVLLGKPPKGFFNKELTEIESLLNATGREGQFAKIKRSSLFLFALGIVTSLLLNNLFLIPVLGAGFAFLPIWYLRSTSMIYKKHLNDELETAVSTITTSYLRSGDILKAVKENIPYLNDPVKNNFESFVIEAEILNANLISAINTLKMKVPNSIFHEWCNTLIQCQSDRSMRSTLNFTVQKFSDIRIVSSELEAIINEPKREAFMMMGLVLFNIPLLYLLNKSWYNTLFFTTPGKITLAICGAIILFAFTRIMHLSKPIEYRGEL